MATAGSIVVDLLLRTGSFETDAQRASKISEKRFKEIEKQAKETASSVSSSFAGLLSGALLGVGVGTVFGKFVEETKNAQNEQAQLAAVLKSTGNAAGFTIAELNKMASGMAGFVSEGDINRAQTRLLSYTGVVGEEFPRALQAAIDMSVRLGMTVEQSAETVGKALDIPSKGLTALSKQGFRFTEDQKKLVESLEQTGRVAEAQDVILKALESSYGGAADAARNTLGGALAALQNQVNDLMTGDDDSVNGLTAAVNEFTDLLGSSETKATFSAFTTFLAEVATGLVTVINEFKKAADAADSWLEAINVKVADTIFGDSDPAKEVENITKRLNENRAAVEKLREAQAANPSGKSKNMFGFEQNENYDQRISVLQSAIRAGEARLVFAQGRLNAKDRDILKGYTGVDETGGPTTTLEPIRATAMSAPAEKAAKERVDQGQKLIDQMNQRIALIGKETEYEKLLEQVRAGSITFKTQAQQDEALAAAQTLDFIAEQTKAYEENQKQAAELSRLIGDLYPDQARTDQYLLKLSLLTEGLDNGALSAERYADAVQRLEERFGSTTDDMTVFAEQAARDIQSQLGNGLYNAIKGNFDSIGSAFADMLARMGADLAASQINKLLLGNFGSSGELGGLLGGVLGGIFGGGAGSGPLATASQVGAAGDGLMFFAEGGYTGPGGKYDPAGLVHAGEYVIPADATRRLGVGFLDRLRGYAEGGYVGGDGLPSVVPGRPMQVQIESHGVDIEVVEAREQRMRIVARQEIEDGTPKIMAREQANANSRFSRQQARSTSIQRRR
ncbi:putative prophage tail length tape measure protein [Bordetella hinzii 5132]|uniref:phage tail length tape measure family protein n=1 Tax=Bordetella hinzii TaxID=103855 RepID=UPI00045A43EA|nr:phage tail length tape measure family protein [Bordetella hinzii]KCB41217.1 putative prophage tail length tape measure protein [Bordetella hinzii 5132]